MKKYSLEYLGRNLKHVETFYDSVGDSVSSLNHLSEIFDVLYEHKCNLQDGIDTNITGALIDEIENVMGILKLMNTKDDSTSYNFPLRAIGDNILSIIEEIKLLRDDTETSD